MTSRAELIAWVNDLLGLNYTKVEQCGSGAAYAHIMDSIYQDVPLGKIKMSANQEYEYLNNYKILQIVFKRHGVDKPIPVQALVKCKMQDNLEFLQWLKKYWDLHFPGGEYDAAARRGGAAADPNPLIGSGGVLPSNMRSSTHGAGARVPSGSAPVKRGKVTTSTARVAPRVGLAGGALKEKEALTSELNELRATVDGLEKERDFYFNKLREIELSIGTRLDAQDGTVTDSEIENLKAIQAILYSTEEGFEVPEVVEEELAGDETEVF